MPQLPKSGEDAKCYDTGNLLAVETYIREKVLSFKQVVSMAALHELYGLNVGDSRYRSKLKTILTDKFPNQLSFIPIHHNKPDVVMSTEAISDYFQLPDNTAMLEQADTIIRNDILNYCTAIPDVSWPPDISELQSGK